MWVVHIVFSNDERIDRDQLASLNLALRSKGDGKGKKVPTRKRNTQKMRRTTSRRKANKELKQQFFKDIREKAQIAVFSGGEGKTGFIPVLPPVVLSKTHVTDPSTNLAPRGRIGYRYAYQEEFESEF